MNSSKKINLFWWSSVVFEGKSQENFGDILSKYLVERISRKEIVWKHPIKHRWNPFHKKIYFTTGSILAHVTKRCIVWGSGIISKTDDVKEAEFLAVRGPETYAFLKEKGYKVNKVFGDPAIVLPTLYRPKQIQKSELGIIPHYVDFELVSDWYRDQPEIKVIDLLDDDVEAVIDEIYSCENIISSSLHGVIVSHAYNIPAVWVQFSKKLSGDNIKFVDYFKSVKLRPYQAEYVQNRKSLEELKNLSNNHPNLPEKSIIKELTEKLMAVCPFKQ